MARPPSPPRATSRARTWRSLLVRALLRLGWAALWSPVLYSGFILFLRYTERSLNATGHEAWYSPAALWLNLEAVAGPLALGLGLSLLPAPLMGEGLSERLGRPGWAWPVTALTTALLCFLWTPLHSALHWSAPTLFPWDALALFVPAALLIGVIDLRRWARLRRGGSLRKPPS